MTVHSTNMDSLLSHLFDVNDKGRIAPSIIILQLVYIHMSTSTQFEQMAVVLITSGGSGIGLMATQALAVNGAKGRVGKCSCSPTVVEKPLRGTVTPLVEQRKHSQE